MQTTLHVIEAVPNDHLDYQPDLKSKTGLGLVRHITLEDEWLLNCIANSEFTPPPDDSDACGIMNPADLTDPGRFPVHDTRRGGQYTYHGPGQIVGYPILDLDNFFTDIHKYLRFLEEMVILTWAHSVAVRQRSYELLAKEFSLRSQPSADAAE